MTLTGTNASTTVWLATKRTAWLTLTTANGTGSGTVAWARNSAGLSVGIYVDTITVTASGATGSPTMIFDTLKITAVAAPLTLAVNPAARSVSVPQGTAAPSDFADVILTGTNASSTVRSASHRQPWFAFSNAGGTGSGTIRWDRNTTGLAAGTYVDTITVTASGAIGSPAVIYDTLKITAAAAVPLVIALSPAGRRVAVVQGNAAPGGNATVTLTGTGSASAPWSATKKTSWVTLATASGTGSGTVAWSRNAAGLSVGTYVDTITVSASGAAGSPTTLFDTLQVTATSSAIALAVNPAARKVSVQIGSAAAGDNATVTLTGTGSQTTSWWAVKKQPWLTLTTAAGMGNGTVTWTRNAAGLAAGTYVDTITVSSAATGSAVVFDTLNVTAPPVPIVVAVNPASRNSAVQQGGNASGDNALVTLTGTNAASTSWSATNRHGWLILVTASGTGNGALVWNRNAGGLGVGTYVDTITVTAAGVAGLPATLYDTLRITAVATPVVLAVSPGSRSISVPQGTAGWGDNVAVTFTGTDAGSAVWSATHTNVSWAAFVNTSGTGNGFVTWNRNLASLAAGTYVDTITVAVAGSPQSLRVYDTVRVTSTIALNPRGHRARTLHFSGVSNLIVAGLDSALVEASAVDSASAAGWVATVNSGRLQLAVATGAVNSYVRWARPAVVLSPGLYVDTISVSLQADRTVRAQFVDSLEVVAVTMPTPDVAVGDLFDHRSLTDDQRDTLDREGNSNGHYDLGDFLAWVNRNHIRLSTAASLKLKQVPPGS